MLVTPKCYSSSLCKKFIHIPSILYLWTYANFFKYFATVSNTSNLLNADTCNDVFFKKNSYKIIFYKILIFQDFLYSVKFHLIGFNLVDWICSFFCFIKDIYFDFFINYINLLYILLISIEWLSDITFLKRKKFV
jgi:hypothetical protein